MDVDVRDAERRWRDEGTLEAEVAWLGALSRTGRVVERQLRLAAHYGHEAAARILDVPTSRPDANGAAVGAWADHVHEIAGHVEHVRVAEYVARLAVPAWDRRIVGHHGPARWYNHTSPADQLALVRAYLTRPGADSALDVARSIDDVSRPDMKDSYGWVAWAVAHDLAEDVAREVASRRWGDRWTEEGPPVEYVRIGRESYVADAVYKSALVLGALARGDATSEMHDVELLTPGLEILFVAVRDRLAPFVLGLASAP